MEFSVKQSPITLHTEESGQEVAIKIVSNLLGPVSSQKLNDLESICKAALETNNGKGIIAKHEQNKKNIKKSEKKSSDTFGMINTYSLHQLKNQAIRFDVSETEFNTPRQSWGFRGFGNTNSDVESRDYEDVLSTEVLRAPICDFCVVQPGEQIPTDFYRLYKTPSNKKANLNSNSGGNPIYLCLRKDLTDQNAHVTNLLVIFPDRNEFVPPGYYVVQKGKNPCNLNTGTSYERIYLCYKKEINGNPLIDVQIIFPSKQEIAPKNFQTIEKSLRGFPANLNSTTGGLETLLCYKQRLKRLECLVNSIEFTNSQDNAAIMKLPSKLHKPQMTGVSSLQRGTKGSMATHTPWSNTEEIAPSKPTRLSKRFISEGSKAPLEIITNNFSTDSGINELGIPLNSSKSNVSVKFMENLKEGDEQLKEEEERISDQRLSDQAIKESASMGGMTIVSRASIINFVDEVYLNGDDENGGIGREDVSDKENDDTTDENSFDPRYFLSSMGSPSKKTIVDSAGNVVALEIRLLLRAILSCIYCRLSEISDIALAGINKLLNETQFFSNDLNAIPLSNKTSMIDLTIEAVCDRFDLSPDNEHEIVLQFLKMVINHSQARLNSLTLQKIFRAVTFICTSYSTKNDWIKKGLSMPCNDVYSDISPFKVLKRLIWNTSGLVDMQNVQVAHYLPITEDSGEFGYGKVDDTSSQSYIDVRVLLEDFIEDVIDCIEVARLSEIVIMTVSKQSASTMSSSFWQSVNSLSKKLFSDYAHRCIFINLCGLCKIGWYGVRVNKEGEPIPRDLGSKLVALEAITEFCLSANEKVRSGKIMGYQVRRMVISCFLYNVHYALLDHRIFTKLMKMLTALWKIWRQCLRIEFATICEHLITKILQAAPYQIKPIYQMIVIQEVINWFDQPHLLVEMFVNYDMDRKFVSHWNIFSYLVRTICTIARRLVNDVIDTASGKDARQLLVDGDLTKMANSVTIRDVHLQALEELARIAKTLMDASGHAYLIIQDSAFRDRSLEKGAGWIEDEDTVTKQRVRAMSVGSTPADQAASPVILIVPNSTPDTKNLDPSLEDDSPQTSEQLSPTSLTRRRIGSIKLRREAHAHAEEVINEAFEIYKKKNSLNKAVDHLLKNDFMPNTPQEIANFLRVYKHNFDPHAIGDFLGEGGDTESEIDYWCQIRFRYTRAVSFVEMDLEPALRLYLTGCGFIMPGEGQKVQRFMEVFAKAFWQDNGNTVYAPFPNQDAAFLTAYAIIMLNTDLHKANVGTARARARKMTKEQFAATLRDYKINQEYLSTIYDNVERYPIESLMNMSSPASAPADEAEVVKNKPMTNEMRLQEERKFIKEVTTGLRDSQDLLRSLSQYSYRFLTGSDAKISLDLISFMYDTVWFNFHTIVKTLLLSKCDMNVKFFALDILCYSLTSALFLDLKVERMTFAALLLEFRETIQPITRDVVVNHHDVPDSSWYHDVEESNPDTMMETIAKVHLLMVFIKDKIQQNETAEITRQVASKFEKKAKILENNTFFIRQGDLSKVSRNGRPVLYRFFLFSDHLIYAKLNLQGLFKVHEQLPLSTIDVSDLDNDPDLTSFFISHPIKSFVVIADSSEVKQQWLRDIESTAKACKKREITVGPGPIGRRMSMIGRIEDQKEIQQREQDTSLPRADLVSPLINRRAASIGRRPSNGSDYSPSNNNNNSYDINSSTDNNLVENSSNSISSSTSERSTNLVNDYISRVMSQCDLGVIDEEMNDSVSVRSGRSQSIQSIQSHNDKRIPSNNSICDSDNSVVSISAGQHSIEHAQHISRSATSPIMKDGIAAYNSDYLRTDEIHIEFEKEFKKQREKEANEQDKSTSDNNENESEKERESSKRMEDLVMDTASDISEVTNVTNPNTPGSTKNVTVLRDSVRIV